MDNEKTYAEMFLPLRYKALREEKGLTMKELSQEIKCNEKTLSFYENGERPLSIGTLQKYAEYFNVSTDYLLGFTDVRSANPELKAISESTGLNDSALTNLISCCHMAKFEKSSMPSSDGTFVNSLGALNALLSDKDVMYNFFYSVYGYIHAKDTVRELNRKSASNSKKTNAIRSFLEKNLNGSEVEHEKQINIQIIRDCLDKLRIAYEESTLDYDGIKREIEETELELKKKQKRLKELKKQMEIVANRLENTPGRKDGDKNGIHSTPKE